MASVFSFLVSAVFFSPTVFSLQTTLHIQQASLSPFACATSPVAANPIPAVNNNVPGEPLRVARNEPLSINVVNLLNDPFALHFHGIRQAHTPYSDGVPQLTQFPIAPNANYIHTFNVPEPGTYFYHAHSKLHAATVYGPLIVTDPQEPALLNYQDDQTLVLGDWFDGANLDAALNQHDQIIPGQSLPFPSTIVVNGKSPGPFSSSLPSAASCSTFTLTLNPSVTTRIRIIHAGIKAAYRIAFPSSLSPHIIEADGKLTQPFAIPATDGIAIGAGQRYSILLTPPQTPPTSPLPILMTLDGINTNTFTYAFINYAASSMSMTTAFVPPDATQLAALASTAYLQDSLLPLQPDPNAQSILSRPASRTIFLEVTSTPDKTGYLVNNVSLVMPPTPLPPLLYQAYFGRAQNVYDYPGVYGAALNDVVDIVIQNGPGFCGHHHPWHVRLSFLIPS